MWADDHEMCNLIRQTMAYRLLQFVACRQHLLGLRGRQENARPWRDCAQLLRCRVQRLLYLGPA